MRIDSRKFQRQSMRMSGYDYSQPGAYFITLVTFSRKHLFGEIIDGEMVINRYGKIVQSAWIDLPHHYPQVTLETIVIMPNHVHGVVVINEAPKVLSRGGSQTRPYEINQNRPNKIGYRLPEIVRAFKSFSARRINQLRKMPGEVVWQRSFYDHVVRNEKDLDNILEYIQTNPQEWEEDQFQSSTEDIPSE